MPKVTQLLRLLPGSAAQGPEVPGNAKCPSNTLTLSRESGKQPETGSAVANTGEEKQEKGSEDMRGCQGHVANPLPSQRLSRIFPHPNTGHHLSRCTHLCGRMGWIGGTGRLCDFKKR